MHMENENKTYFMLFTFDLKKEKRKFYLNRNIFNNSQFIFLFFSFLTVENIF